MEVSGQFHAPVDLPPRKDPSVTIGQEAGGLHNRCGRRGEETSLDGT
jgi:hypothetical protein